jgi:hypothetical protein
MLRKASTRTYVPIVFMIIITGAIYHNFSNNNMTIRNGTALMDTEPDLSKCNQWTKKSDHLSVIVGDVRNASAWIFIAGMLPIPSRCKVKINLAAPIGVDVSAAADSSGHAIGWLAQYKYEQTEELASSDNRRVTYKVTCDGFAAVKRLVCVGTCCALEIQICSGFLSRL